MSKIPQDKINGGKARKRKAEYWLMLSFTWNPSSIVDFKQESRVNDNRKRARMTSPRNHVRHYLNDYKPSKQKDRHAWRQKPYRRLCRLWHKLPNVKIKWGGKYNKK